MHQHTHQYALTPILHQPLTIPPAPMGTQDSNFDRHLPRGAAGPSFAPVTAFHRAAQKLVRSTKRGRWSAMHVSIAWKIYYHKQLKTMQQKPNSLHREQTPEYPSNSQPERVQQKESDQPFYVRSDIAPHHYHTTKREKLEHMPSLQQKEKHEKEKHRVQHVETTWDLCLGDISWDQMIAPEPDSRKRQLEFDSSVKVKRVKQEIVAHHSASLRTLHTDTSPSRHTHPSPHTMPLQHINRGDLSVVYPNSSRCNVTRTPGGLISCPGAEMHPYQTASWQQMWDVHKRMHLHPRKNIRQDYSLNTCKAIRIPLVVQRQKEAFHGCFTPPFYFPLALRQQETVYLTGREFVQSQHENGHLHHLGYLAASHMGP